MVELHTLVTFIGIMIVGATFILQSWKYKKDKYADQVVHGGAGSIAGPIITYDKKRYM